MRSSSRHYSEPSSKSRRKNHSSSKHRTKKQDSTKRRHASHSRKKQTKVKEPSFSQKLVGQIFNIIYYLVVISLIAGSTLFLANKDHNKSYFGYRVYNVMTNSMVPQKDSPKGGFYAGDLIIVQMIEGKNAKVGDVVTFHVGNAESEAFLTHRVVETLHELNGKEGNYVITKGDANESKDPPIEAGRIIGKKVFTIPKLGSILEFIRNNFVVSFVFLLSIFGFVYVLRLFFLPSNKK